MVASEASEKVAKASERPASPAVKSHAADPLPHPDLFVRRHIGPRPEDARQMLETLELKSLDQLVEKAVPAQIRLRRELDLPRERSEFQVLAELKELASQNQVFRSYIGMGYYDCITPAVIQRNVLENPGWYTQYTPYQAEVAQGRLESLLNFQTMVIDLTGLPVANASLLDEATAAAEAMTLAWGAKGREAGKAFFVSEACHPQTIEVVRTRAEPLGIEVLVGDHRKQDLSAKPIFGVLV